MTSSDLNYYISKTNINQKFLQDEKLVEEAVHFVTLNVTNWYVVGTRGDGDVNTHTVKFR